MTYRHKSSRCSHHLQNSQGSNEYQLRITCQHCQGHLAIVYARHLTEDSRRLIREHLDTTPAKGQRPLPRARAAAETPQPQDTPEPAEPQEDIEEHRARLNQEIQRLQAELEGLPRRETPPPPAENPPEAEEAGRQKCSAQ